MKTPPPYLLFDAGFDAESAAPRAFTSPKQIICAWQPNEVATAFATLQQAHDNGDWLAGVCAYELGYVLEDALHPYLPDNRRTPLLCFGVFDAPATPQQTQALLDTARDDSKQTPNYPRQNRSGKPPNIVPPLIPPMPIFARGIFIR